MAVDSTRLKFEQVCADCQSSDFVEDHAQGDLTCTVSIYADFSLDLTQRLENPRDSTMGQATNCPGTK